VLADRGSSEHGHIRNGLAELGGSDADASSSHVNEDLVTLSDIGQAEQQLIGCQVVD